MIFEMAFSSKYQRCNCNQLFTESRFAVGGSNTEVPDGQSVLPKGDIDYQQGGLLLIIASFKNTRQECVQAV